MSLRTSSSPRMRWATCRGAFFSLMSGAALNLVKPTRWAKPRNDFTVATLHVLHRAPPQICASGVQRFQEARPDALVGAPGVGGAVGMALEPDRQQIGVGTRVGVQRRQPIY